MFPQVVQVLPTDDYQVYVYFADGKVMLFDVKPLLGKGVFKALEDASFFKERCTVLNNTLAWDVSGTYDPRSCIDIDPQSLYEQAVDSSDPLAEGLVDEHCG